tara:strand:- start:11811 stop:12158 length:348 start_codon:yes stop_codon:yes gene_type:complete
MEGKKIQYVSENNKKRSRVNIEAEEEFAKEQYNYFFCVHGYFPDQYQELTEVEKLSIEEQRKERNRQKQKEKRIEKKELEKSKLGLEYQQKINDNREIFGLKKKKIKTSIKSFFK